MFTHVLIKNLPSSFGVYNVSQRNNINNPMFINNPAKKQPISIIFGKQHTEET